MGRGLTILEARQWLLWDLDEGRKRCYNRFGEPCGSTDEAAYCSYDEASQAAETLGRQGPAFCFTSADPWLGIDLDDCLLDYRTPKPWVVPILERFTKTYLEVSPSLRGVKIYVMADKPQHRSQVSVEDGGIEVYDHGRFFTFTRFRLEGYGSDAVADCQAEVDWLYATYFAQANEQAVSATVLTFACANDAEQRAADYLAHAALPLPGTRNRTVFSLAGHLRAFGLQEGRVAEMLLSWNASLVEPLDDREVLATVGSNFRSPTPREPKPDGVVAMPVMLPDWARRESSPFFRQQEPPASAPSRPDPAVRNGISVEPFPAELLQVPGFVGDFVRHCEASCFLRQPAVALAAGIALQGVLAGRKVKDRYENRSNVYTLALSDSATGKEHPRKIANAILAAIGAWSSLGDLETPKSGSAIARALQAHPARLALIDEFGRFMRFSRAVNASGFISEIGDVLLKLYSSAEGRWSAAQHSDRTLNVEIDRPNFSIFATTVPGNFWDSMSIDQLTDGLLARFLIVHGDPEPEEGPAMPGLELPAGLVEHARSWFESGGQLGNTSVAPPERLVPHTEDAFALMKAIFSEANVGLRGRPRDQRAIFARVPQHTCRLALIYACSRSAESPEIDLEAVEWAHAVVSHAAAQVLEQAHAKIAESEFHRQQNRLLEFVATRPEGVSIYDLSRRFRNWPKRDREAIITNLVDTGAIESVRVETGGRPAMLLKAV